MNEQALVVIDGDASSVRRDTRLPKARGLEGQGFFSAALTEIHPAAL